MDKLEAIVSKRKLPTTTTTDEKKKKPRRIRPTPLPSTSSSSALVNFYYKQAEDITTDCNNAIAMYNTTIGYSESMHIVKQRFPLSDTIYILVGLEMTDCDIKPRIYFVDKRWWTQLMVTDGCIDILRFAKTKFDNFFNNSSSSTSLSPLYTDRIKVTTNSPSAAVNGEASITLTKRCRDYIPSELDWEHPDWVFTVDPPAPSVTLNREEWNKLCQLAESILEYHELCVQCVQAATMLLERYVRYFTTKYRPQVLTASQQQEMQQQQQVLDNLTEKLPSEVKSHHWTRLSNPPVYYYYNADGTRLPNDESLKTTPLLPWLDAEFRAHCNERVANEVKEKLMQEFSWLK